MGIGQTSFDEALECTISVGEGNGTFTLNSKGLPSIMYDLLLGMFQGMTKWGCTWGHRWNTKKSACVTIYVAISDWSRVPPGRMSALEQSHEICWMYAFLHGSAMQGWFLAEFSSRLSPILKPPLNVFLFVQWNIIWKSLCWVDHVNWKVHVYSCCDLHNLTI